MMLNAKLKGTNKMFQDTLAAGEQWANDYGRDMHSAGSHMRDYVGWFIELSPKTRAVSHIGWQNGMIASVFIRDDGVISVSGHVDDIPWYKLELGEVKPSELEVLYCSRAVHPFITEIDYEDRAGLSEVIWRMEKVLHLAKEAFHGRIDEADFHRLTEQYADKE